jgi:predicted RNase H-like nuclease (RuvC/YqgF family)
VAHLQEELSKLTDEVRRKSREAEELTAKSDGLEYTSAQQARQLEVLQAEMAERDSGLARLTEDLVSIS